jgi:hypothetical protein
MSNVNVRTFVLEPCLNDWETALALGKEWRERLPESDPRRGE